jgi:cytosine/adenosine deaminase-related metal-dependent hydrolase
VIVIRGALALTMDEHLGDLPDADILIEGDRISAIGVSGQFLGVDAEIIDGRGKIVIPGLVNAHMHTWQTALRSVASNWTLLEYFKKMHDGLATVFRPEDLHIATLVGALNQINCGTTTLVDWCHNNPTPAHNDASIDALQEAGIRAAFFHGTPKPNPKPGQPGFWEIPHPRAELERLQQHRVGGLVSLGAAILGPHYSTMEVARQDFRTARELGLIASMHQGGGPPRTPEGWPTLEREGLLGPDVNIVHGNDLTDDQLARFCDAGMTFSIAPENEMTQGHGFPITGRLRDLGRAPSLGIDLESVISGDMLTAARITLGTQRALDNADSRARTGAIPETSTITAREALSWVTVEGARMLKMEKQIGSLTPGKQADLVLIDSTAINMQPMHDAVASVVMQASLANIEGVMIAGRWRKQSGSLLVDGVADKVARLHTSGRRILDALALH